MACQNCHVDEEVEDIVGDIKYSDSQKSIATTSNIYSLDFTGSCCSDKHNSSGRDTYVITRDSESSTSCEMHDSLSSAELFDKPKPLDQAKYDKTVKFEQSTTTKSTSAHKCLLIAEETFTQTSKTIIELAEIEEAIKNNSRNKSLETQTSFISITENTVQYSIEVSQGHTNFTRNKMRNEVGNAVRIPLPLNSLEDGSSKFPVSESELERTLSPDMSDNSDYMINLVDEEEEDRKSLKELSDKSIEESDIEEDSLMTECHRPKNVETLDKDSISDICETTRSVDRDVEDLYSKLSDNTNLFYERPDDLVVKQRINTLTPLTEESFTRSLIDITPHIVLNNVSCSPKPSEEDIVFTNESGMKVKVFSNDSYNLPPIKTKSVPNSPHHLNMLFAKRQLPCVYETEAEKHVDRWEIENNHLAAGESTMIDGKSLPKRKQAEAVFLPPIHTESRSMKVDHRANVVVNMVHVEKDSVNAICINDRIRELKAMNGRKRIGECSHSSTFSLRSVSPTPGQSSRGSEAIEKGCEALTVELLRKMRSDSWCEVTETLEELPKAMEKFWDVLTEHRIADLIRQVCSLVESPRTQVARAGCTALAAILKNTNYTKKPDFYEAVMLLLSKTGSFSRPVRTAANVALDDIVCTVDITHSVTAICVHGVSHKSPLVRTACARLLVVSAALGSGGRLLLRSRPATAATARRYALGALSALLNDRSVDCRKYAERLYLMLRPLPNFEAYYLTDVDVETATSQMKRFDQLLFSIKGKETR